MDDDFDYNNSNHQVLIVANYIEGIEYLDKMIEMQNRAETFGAFLDPTAFIKKADALRIDKERTSIIRDAQVKLKALRKTYNA